MDQTKGHILVISAPLQGHISPLLKLSHQITKLGSGVTFLTTEAARVRMAKSDNAMNQGIRMMSIPDCPEYGDDNNWGDQEKVYMNIARVMPGFLMGLLSNNDDGDRISGVIIDSPFSWVLGVAKKFGIKAAVFWVTSAGCLALGFKIPQLIEDGFIDGHGTPLKTEAIPLLPDIPAMASSDLIWYFPGDINIKRKLFHATKSIMDHMKDADWILCNFFDELDPELSTIASNILPIGPLLGDRQPYGGLWSEDSSCLKWLDKHEKGSVVYVAFGSSSRFSQKQLDELALGLELTGLPFLWVARSSLSNANHLVYTEDYKKRVEDRGKIVEWAPQEVVLSHPSVGCFMSHCGWNSTIESMSMGVPLVCWPYFGDQMYVRTCICDAWRVGVRLSPDEEGGIVSRFEVKKRVDEVMCDGDVKRNVLRMKEMARKSVGEGGSSLANLTYVVEQMKMKG